MRRAFLLSLFCIFHLVTSSEEPGGAEYRDFRSQTGSVLRARILSLDEAASKVALRSTGGQDLTLDLNLFSEGDQIFIRNWDPDERTKASLARYDKDRLLAFYGMAPVPMEWGDGEFFIPVILNQKTSLFFMDTGTFLSIVDRKVATAAGAEFTGTNYADFTLADGSIETVKSALFKEFRLGQISSPGWQMGTCDLAKVGRPYDGIIGSDYLELRRGVVDWKNLEVFLTLAKDRAFTVPASDDEPRKFTLRNETLIVGQIVGVGDHIVKLKVDGKVQSIKEEDLSTSDREYIDLWATDPFRLGVDEMTVDDVLRAKGYQPIDYSFGNSTIPAFELKIRTKTLRFLINPSFRFSFFDKKTANELDLLIEPSRDTLMTTASEVIQLETSIVRGLEAGESALPPLLFRIIEMEAAGANGAVPIHSCTALRFPELRERLTKKADIDGVLGRDLLVELGALIDYDSRRLFIAPSEDR